MAIGSAETYRVTCDSSFELFDAVLDSPREIRPELLRTRARTDTCREYIKHTGSYWNNDKKGK